MKSNGPQWIVARLGEDYNWWLESTSNDEAPAKLSGILDPRQAAHLVEVLEDYRDYGLDPAQLDKAFKLFTLESEIEEGRIRLGAADVDSLAEGEVFGLPIMDGEGSGPYFDFLQALSAVRIRKLNASHDYVVDCTQEEMYAELDGLDDDRYFSDEAMHCFEEINQILEWSPAEWDDSAAS